MCVKQGASGGRCFAVLRLANSPEQTHQRDQRRRCAPNHPGAASRAGGVSGLSSSVAYASQMTAKDAGRALEGTDMELRRGAQVGPSRTAGQAKPPTEHGDVRFALQWTGLHQQAAAGCRIRHMPDGRWQLPWRPQVVGWWADQRGHKSHLSPKRVTPRPNRPRNRDLRAK